MATPDYLQQVIVSGRRSGGGRANSARRRVFQRPSVTSLVWATLDLLTVVVAAVMAQRLQMGNSADHPGSLLPQIFTQTPKLWLGYLAWFGGTLVFFARSYGLYGPIQNRSGLHEQRMTVQATLTSGLLLCGALYVLRGDNVPRVVVLLLVGITAVLLSVRRAIWRSMEYSRYREGLETRNVLIVGAGRVAHALRNHLESLRHLGFRFKGFVALTEREAESGDADVIGDIKNCLSLARALFVDEIFFSVPADKKLVIALVEEARAVGIDVRVVPDLYDGLAWNAPVEYIGQFPTIPLHRRDFPIGSFLMKRALDIMLSSIALLVASPILAGIAIAVRMDSTGPIFYKAARIGRKGRTFNCFKFRTMVPNADHLKASLEHMNEREGVLFKIVNDPRITKVGRVLRKYSLDEIPQFYNVLRGDMSLVGPRPPIASEVEQYDLAHLRRLDVLPGITGLWQVEARQDPSFDSYISLDTAYVENWTFWLDLKILARTVGVVFSGTGS
ncbi:sugar transferase [Granulicella tundricola]|uniref:Exopolysaccharide biosynthesis polyprenyl glycosylphosphotransferase n=1 Tax=Granulicella tundricola (strain ATCC BAA-1859 / DSM 23138 / MP5ACTX9) TaxID=1198114 RepID=E8WYU1_GRATM|nr:sugar transferase [Granulicella tundricola]ADW68777.1 exopolysaccharide biosynthesis polyprenyl glycosylphosphotransferase [Granulicella tundricola MP5ACTX9]